MGFLLFVIILAIVIKFIFYLDAQEEKVSSTEEEKEEEIQGGEKEEEQMAINKKNTMKISFERAAGIALMIPALYYTFSFCAVLLFGDYMSDIIYPDGVRFDRKVDHSIVDTITMMKFQKHFFLEETNPLLYGVMAVVGAYLLKGSDTKKSI